MSLSQKDRILSNYSEEIIAYVDKYNFELCGHSNYDMDGFIYQIEDFIKNPDSNIDLSSFRYDKFYDNQKVAIFGYIITIKSEENSQIRLKSEALKTLMNISHLEENTTELKGINFVKSRMKKILNEISKEPNAETRKMYLGDLNKLFEKCEEFYTPSQISSIKNEETKKFFDDMKEFFNKQNNFLKGEIGQLESSRDCGSFETLSGEDMCKGYDEMFSEGSPKQSI